MTPEKANKILKLLKKNYPNPKTILEFSNNFELLLAVMLSAQTTDVQVNKVTSSLFDKYRGKNELEEIKNFANLDLKMLENEIKSIGLYKNKAKNIKATSIILLDKFNGIIPKNINELILLPGVGRKTANVVLGAAYGIANGIAIDTHVKRLSLKYGFSKSKNPLIIEKDLMKLFDKKDWINLTHLLIMHGRNLRKLKKDFIDE